MFGQEVAVELGIKVVVTVQLSNVAFHWHPLVLAQDKEFVILEQREVVTVVVGKIGKGVGVG
jgi:hypothetical protein